MLRLGVGPIAASVAAFAIGFISYLSLTMERAPASARSRAEGRAFSAFGDFDPRPVGLGATTVGSDIRGGFRARWASLDAEGASKFAFDEQDNQAEPWSGRSSFGERFSIRQPDAPDSSLQLTAWFDDRFADKFTASGAPARSAAAMTHATAPRVATAAATSRAAAGSVVAQAEPRRAQESRIRLASASATSLPVAYAPTDSTSKASNSPADVDASRTAIYDISSQTVYLPSGRRLEAHSGLGDQMDDPRYVSMRSTGPTPPNVYELKLRESLFHGVRAIRLIPTDGSKMYGRDGILAHSYLLGPNGQSNGCVSFSDYGAFLDAFLQGEVNRLVVVERLADPPPSRTASDWFKDLFRRS